MIATDFHSPAVSQPWFFVGNTRHLTEVDGGFRTMGVQLTEFLNAK